jgi:hypothetical protein
LVRWSGLGININLYKELKGIGVVYHSMSSQETMKDVSHQRSDTVQSVFHRGVVEEEEEEE